MEGQFRTKEKEVRERAKLTEALHYTLFHGSFSPKWYERDWSNVL